MEVLFILPAEDYEGGMVMITSNLLFSRWQGLFKDPMTTGAAIDRLVHHSVILELQDAAIGWSSPKSTKRRQAAGTIEAEFILGRKQI